MVEGSSKYVTILALERICKDSPALEKFIKTIKKGECELVDFQIIFRLLDLQTRAVDNKFCIATTIVPSGKGEELTAFEVKQLHV